MKVTSVNVKDSLIVSIEGRIDTNTAPALEEEVHKVLGDTKRVVLDFTNVEYISSAGLRVVLSLHKELKGKGGELVIAHAKDEVMEIFDMTGFSGFLIFEE